MSQRCKGCKALTSAPDERGYCINCTTQSLDEAYGITTDPLDEESPSAAPTCACVCRECAEGDHCGEGVQVGLGDCLYPLKERTYPRPNEAQTWDACAYCLARGMFTACPHPPANRALGAAMAEQRAAKPEPSCGECIERPCPHVRCCRAFYGHELGCPTLATAEPVRGSEVDRLRARVAELETAIGECLTMAAATAFITFDGFAVLQGVTHDGIPAPRTETPEPGLDALDRQTANAIAYSALGETVRVIDSGDLNALTRMLDKARTSAPRDGRAERKRAYDRQWQQAKRAAVATRDALRQVLGRPALREPPDEKTDPGKAGRG